MTEILFPGNSYETPKGKRTFWGALFPSLSFYIRYLCVVARDGSLAYCGKYGGKEWTRGSYDTLRHLEASGVRLHVRGLDAIDPAEGPFVFIGNHMSTLETCVLPCLIQPRLNVTFIVKESLVRYPFFGPVLRTRNPIVVKRKNPREDLQAVLEQGEERLKNGQSVIVFPQSTRSVELVAKNFNSIGVKLAKRAQVRVIPVALRTDAWGMGSLAKDFGPIRPQIPVHISFGPSFMVAGNGKAEHAEVYAFIGRHLTDWGLAPARIDEDGGGALT